MYAEAAGPRATAINRRKLTGRRLLLARGGFGPTVEVGRASGASSSALVLWSHRSTATLVPAASRTLTCSALGLGGRPREGLTRVSSVAMLSIITHRATFGTQAHTHGTYRHKRGR